MDKKNPVQVIAQMKKDKKFNKNINKDTKEKLLEKFKKKPKLYFYYERTDNGKFKDPKDLRNKLYSLMIMKYENKPLSDIPLSTELFIKMFSGRVILKYKVINEEWGEGIETRTIKDIIFNKKMFEWIPDDNEYGIIDEPFYDT